MATNVFLEGATGDPTGSLRQLTTHLCRSTSDYNTPRDTIMNGGAVRVLKGSVDPSKVRLGGVPSLPLLGKALLQPWTYEFGDVDPADRCFAIVLANLFKYYKVTALTAGSLWEFALTTLSGPTAADPYIEGIEDSNVLPRLRYLDGIVGAMEFTSEPENGFLASADMVAGRFDWWGEVTQVTGAGSTKPTLLGEYVIAGGSDALDVDFTDSLFLEVVGVAAGVATLKAKFSAQGGGAPAFGANTFAYELGNTAGAIVIDSDSGEEISLPSRPLLVTAVAGATLTATDVFEYRIRRTALSQSLPADRSLSAVNTRIYSGTNLISAEGGWTARAEWGSTEVKADASFEQGAKTTRKGDLQVTLTPTREITDLQLQNALLRKEPLSFVVQGISDVVIPGDTERYSFTLILPSVIPEGPAYGVEAGAENTEESVVLRAGAPAAAFEFPAGSGNMYSSHAHALLKTDFAVL